MTDLLQNLIDAIALGSVYALIAPGIALIFGIMRLINFAHGELVMVGAYGIVLVGDAPWPILLFVPLITSVLFALAMERVAFRPVRGASPATLLVTSFAVSYGLQNLAILVLGANTRSTGVFDGLLDSVTVDSLVVPKLSILAIVTTAVLVVALELFLHRTRIGVQMRAAAENFRMARALGVRANAVIALVFGISGLLTGVAAILTVARTGTASPTMGLQLILAGFIATVIGGLGNLRGAILGAFVLGAISVALTAYLPDGLRTYQLAITYGAVIVILVLRPEGLIRSRSDAVRV